MAHGGKRMDPDGTAFMFCLAFLIGFVTSSDTSLCSCLGTRWVIILSLFVSEACFQSKLLIAHDF